MKKYSIIINHIGDDKYAVVMKKWELDESGQEINIENLIKSDLTLQQAIDEQTKFLQ